MIFGTPNLLAWLALVSMLPISLVVCRMLRPSLAVPGLLIFFLMFMPQRIAFDFQGLPSLDKEVIGYLSVLLGLLVSRPQLLARARIGQGPDLLVLGMMVFGFFTIWTNRDPLMFGPTFKPGLDLWAGLSTAVDDLLLFGVPFVLGRAVIRNARELRTTLMLLAAAGLVYSALILIEVRLSPQLHNWIYGYHQNQFAKNVRFGGYRPIVFMTSGIAVGIFMTVTVMAAATLARARQTIFGLPAALASYYLLVILIICKSIAAAVWGLAFLPVLSFSPLPWLRRMALVLVAFVAIYPALRMTEIFPVERLVAVAASFDEQRAASLNYRFENEDALLERWRERPFFGWGGYSRNWVYDPDTGRSRTVPDGAWIIQVSSRGLAGLAMILGLYLQPVAYAARNLRRVRSRHDRMILLGAMLIVMVRAMDQLPNGFYTSLPIFLAGGIYRTVQEEVRASRRRPRRRAPPSPPNPEAEPEPEPR